MTAFRPLAGVRVLSFEVAVSLPAGTRILADLGAEVVRVGRPTAEQDAFIVLNYDGSMLNKQSLALDLRKGEARDVVERLTAKADVVCINYRPDVMRRFGYDYESFRKVRPDIIVLQLSGYGRPGPWELFPAFGHSVEAAGGMNALIGDPDDQPTQVGSRVLADQLSGKYAAVAILGALNHRRETGEGRHIDVSMYESIVHSQGDLVLAVSISQSAPVRRGNRTPFVAPQGIYPCLDDDQWLALTVASDDEWASLRAVLADSRLDAVSSDSLAARTQNHDAIDAVIAAWTRTKDKDAAAEALQGAGIAAGPVRQPADIPYDPQHRHRELFQFVEHDLPVLGYIAHPHLALASLAVGFERAKLTDARNVGTDNTPVLIEWGGYSPEEIAALEQCGAVMPPAGLEKLKPATPPKGGSGGRPGRVDPDFARRLGLIAGRSELTPLSVPQDASSPLSVPQEWRGVGGEESPPPDEQRSPPLRSEGMERGSRRLSAASGDEVRALDLTSGAAGGFATLLLAEMGFEVTKVEAPGARTYSADLDETAFAFLNRRKKSVQLDLSNDAGRASLRAMIETADLLFEDATPGSMEGSMESDGLGWDALHRVNPALVLVSITPFGQSGPRAGWKASEFVLQAMGGVVATTGWADGSPQSLPGHIASCGAALHAVAAGLAAVYGVRAGTTDGVHIDVSIQEAMATFATREVQRYVYTGQDVARFGREFGMQGWPPIGIAADGYIMMEALRAEWEAFAHFLGLDDRFLTHEFNEPETRAARWAEIRPDFERAVRARTKYQWFEDSAAHGYTFAPIDTLLEVLHSPQAEARTFFSDLEGGPGRTPRPPFTGFSSAMPNRAPSLGEHTAEFSPPPERRGNGARSGME